VAKRPYSSEKSGWLKIRNPRSAQEKLVEAITPAAGFLPKSPWSMIAGGGNCLGRGLFPYRPLISPDLETVRLASA